MPPSTHSTTIAPADVRAVLRAPRLGPAGEVLASRHLVDDGLTVLARNWRVADGAVRGELDVVAVDDARCVLVVCEVKTRRDARRFGGAVAAVDRGKVARLRRLTSAFLWEGDGTWPRVRLDVVAIDLAAEATLTHLEDVS